MKQRFWLNVALLVAVAALALFVYFKPHRSSTEFRLSTLKAGDIKSIKIENAGAAPIVLERAGADWRLTAPLAARADGFQAQRLLEILDATAQERFPATGLARYDLSEPAVRLTLGGQLFSFGTVNTMSREQYVLTQDGVYLVPLQYRMALPRDALQIASKQLFAADEAPVAFEFPDFKVVQQDGKWQLAPPAADASQDDFARWVDEWRLATAIALQPVSGRKALATIKVKLKNGEDITLAVLARDPALVLARSDQPFEHQFAAESGARLLAPPATAK